MAEQPNLPHKLTLNQRRSLSITGVSEVISFDEHLVVLKTALGELMIHGQQLQLKQLSPEGGQLAVEGEIHALIYGQTRKSGLRRLLG